jgi:hypothetical protein
MTMPMKSSAHDGAAADFKNLAECKRWLGALPLTNVQSAQAEITSQLNLLQGVDVPAQERLRIAEHLRETVDFIQGQSARKYLNKPMPLGAAETAASQASNGLWQALRGTYQRCLDAALAGDAETTEWMPLITQRCLRYTTFLIIEQCRMYQGIGGILWQQLNQLFLIAEERGFSEKPVKDSLNRQMDASTCQAAYVHALLVAAANPNHLSARHLNVLDKWLDKWAARVPISSQRPNQPDLPILAVDVAGQAGPFLVDDGTSSSTLRFLHTTRLAEGLRKRIKFLRKGGSPAELDLGEECAQPGCEAFLTEIYRQWFEPAASRASTRRSGVQQAEVVFGMTDAYVCSNGMKPFEQPAKNTEFSREELLDLQMFGHVRERRAVVSPQQPGIALADWDILDESALGFRLARASTTDVQIVFNQLVALRPKDANAFVLGSVKWLSFEADGSVVFGVRTQPATVVPVAARQVKLQAAELDFAPAFRLSASPAQQLPESLVLPRGWFKHGARVEIFDGAYQTLIMSGMLEVGSDFERVSFTLG